VTPKVHDLADLADLAGQPLAPLLRQVQVFAVEARYEEGPFPPPAERQRLLILLEPRSCGAQEPVSTPNRSCNAAMMRALAAGKG
jgi:hypothetical protein